MLENRRQNVIRDYKERFEFKLTVGENIICQRYFRINNFNEQCVYSVELSDMIRDITKRIDDELKSKTCDYLRFFAPIYFKDVEEMEKYFSVPSNRERISVGHGIVVKSEDTDYCWGNNGKPFKLNFKFDDSELINGITENEVVTYKFAFLIDEKEVCTATWEGVYPRFVRNAIDLSNKKGRVNNDLGFEEYLNYRISADRGDLVNPIIKDICTVCSLQGDNCYTLTCDFDNTIYRNKQSYTSLCKLYGLSPDGLIRYKSKKEIEFWEKK